MPLSQIGESLAKHYVGHFCAEQGHGVAGMDGHRYPLKR
jgi:hypothetical protein